MESKQNLKKRLKSVDNISQITRAMELVSATKMRKSQEAALASRPYALTALSLLADLCQLEEEMPKLLKPRKGEKTLFVLVASDKGLAGAFNNSLLRKFEQFLKDKKINLEQSENFFLAIGEKSNQYLIKKNLTIVKKFSHIGDYADLSETEPIAKFLVEGYLAKKWDKVIVFSTHFHSDLKQEPMKRQILPIEFESLQETIKEIIPERGRFAELLKENEINLAPEKNNLQEYLIEPSPKQVLEKLAEHLFSMQIYHLILEANASEHAARCLAMKTASDNANELVDDLQLIYNKSRQAAITNEIIEITAGVNIT